LMEHAAGSPGALIQLSTSSTEYPGYYQDYYGSHGYIVPTYLHNDWDTWTIAKNPVGYAQSMYSQNGGVIRDRGYSYSYGPEMIPFVVVIVALVGYIIYKQ